MKLWIPHGSKFLHDTNWMIEHFQEGNRIETIMITAPDVLVPEVLQTVGPGVSLGFGLCVVVGN